ncbi:UDP-N-acetylmuramoyl-L-alanine--D-glutamate ligase [Uliginosibacterium sediminicola]|uniref:UDP-N-acetylmuramoylalanine--D-glutamate ligase n=1 Tax=Uliginosibacterium sediminicola TaxID=2024550 RepID=A0ABU9YWN8_9RHOO
MSLYSDRHCLVLGLGESGLAAAQWLARQGARLRIADSRTVPPGREAIHSIAPQAELICAPFSPQLLEGIELLVISPGLDPREPVVQLARSRGIEITGEIELFAQALREIGWRAESKLIAITGTNGKTTTTALCGELCRAAGLDAAVAGNISPAALSELMLRLDAGQRPDVWVLELSSFQLETTRSLDADAAVILNVSDDHLDRHGDMQSYAQAKAAVFAGSGVQVLNREDVWVAGLGLAGRRVVDFGLSAPQGEAQYGIRQIEGEHYLCRGSEVLLAHSALQLAGMHNLANALAALALCEAIGLPREALLAGLRAFRGLPHRVERVARREDGVDFYDDSKGTNVGATLAALQGLGRRVVLIAGGDGKGQDFRPLSPALQTHARSMVLIGRDAARLAAETADSAVPTQFAPSMEEAVLVANFLAQAGDAVLLSPACASLDMFRNYAHRAQVFCDAVLQLPGVRRV